MADCKHMDSHIHGDIKVAQDNDGHPFRYIDLTVRCTQCDQLMTFIGPTIGMAKNIAPAFKEWPAYPASPTVSADGYHLLAPMGDDSQVKQCDKCSGSFQYRWMIEWLNSGGKSA